VFQILDLPLRSKVMPEKPYILRTPRGILAAESLLAGPEGQDFASKLM